METTRGAFHPTRFQDVAVTVDFHCNSACRFCIVQEGMNRWKGVPLEQFKKLVDENVVSHKYDRVIFTGGEVTLEKSLFTFIEVARASGSFRHIRLQTNGRRLADDEYARSVVDAGVDEFFVSIHGADAAVHDHITQRKGSFDELVRGLANLQTLGVRIVTNTVLNSHNVATISGIVDIAAAHGVSRMELWNYLPMEDHEDVRGLIAPVGDMMPNLRAALDRCREKGVEAVTKYVPRCLLGDHAATLDNSQPDVIIIESFWSEFPRFNCVYEGVCEHSEECLGLSHDYVNKFGWEEAALAPVKRTRPFVEREEIVQGKPEEYPGGSPRSTGHPAWEALLGDLPEAMATVAQITVTRNQVRYKLALASGKSEVELVLAARDEAAPALLRSRSFNVFYTGASGTFEKPEMESLLRFACEQIAARDDGALSLDARKGLVQITRPKRTTDRR